MPKDGHRPDDPSLVARLRAGDERAFDEVYERYHARLYAFLWRLAGGAGMAEDLAQETWLRFARRARALREDTRLAAWLFTVARNLAVSQHRWRALDGESLGHLRQCSPPSASPFELTAAAEAGRRVEAAVAALPLLYREVIALVAIDGMTPAEAAQVVGCAPEALRQRLSRARAVLRAALDSPREAGEDRSDG